MSENTSGNRIMADTTAETIQTTLMWRADCYGYPKQAIYLGDVYAGSIYQYGCRDRPTPSTPPWRAWFSSDEDGRLVGWFETAAKAKDALEREVKRAINSYEFLTRPALKDKGAATYAVDDAGRTLAALSRIHNMTPSETRIVLGGIIMMGFVSLEQMDVAFARLEEMKEEAHG